MLERAYTQARTHTRPHAGTHAHTHTQTEQLPAMNTWHFRGKNAISFYERNRNLCNVYLRDYYYHYYTPSANGKGNILFCLTSLGQEQVLKLHCFIFLADYRNVIWLITRSLNSSYNSRSYASSESPSLGVRFPESSTHSRFCFSICSCSALLLGNLSLLFSFFHFMRRF